MTNSPRSSEEKNNQPTNWLEKGTFVISIIVVLGSLGGVWLNGNNKSVEQSARIYTLEQKVDSLAGVTGDIRELKTSMDQVKEGNRDVADALKDLSVSQTKLAVAIGKLQERTGVE